MPSFGNRHIRRNGNEVVPVRLAARLQGNAHSDVASCGPGRGRLPGGWRGHLLCHGGASSQVRRAIAIRYEEHGMSQDVFYH